MVGAEAPLHALRTAYIKPASTKQIDPLTTCLGYRPGMKNEIFSRGGIYTN